ncbi:MAG: hypothetical protein AB2722_18055 [Candidatus Thiodiazotropha sp.]
MNGKPITTILVALICFCSIGPSHADFDDSLEEGKAYGSNANASMPDASTLVPEDVPGYETASPPESDYYNNPAAVGDAASQAAASNEAAQDINEGFATRPVYTIDSGTDPMLQRQDQAEANSASIAGALEGEYADCEPVVFQGSEPADTETCTESKSLETASCRRTNDCSVTGRTIRCEPMHFPCSPTRPSCCSLDIICRGDGAVAVSYQDCCGQTHTSIAQGIDDFHAPGLQYNLNSRSRIVCAANGACIIDFTDYRCNSPTVDLGLHPDVNRFSFDMEPVVECVIQNGCAELEDRVR